MKKIACVLFAGLVMSACGDDGGPAPDGESCSSDDGCESGLCTTEFMDGTEIEGGQCTQECEIDWSDWSDTCPDGQICLIFLCTGEQHCYQDCASDDECRDDWSCAQVSHTESACVPPLDGVVCD